MFSLLSNNAYIMVSTYLALIVLWFLCGRMSSWRVRRGVRATIVFLAIPIAYFGHPFTYFPLWVLLVMFIEELSLRGAIAFAISLVTLRGVIWLAHQYPRKQA